jgi:hypothetical protein
MLERHQAQEAPMARLQSWFTLGLLLVGSLGACSSVVPSNSTRTTPFFLPSTEDAPALARLTHELDAKALRCVEAANCEQVSFDRALVRLFENREAARASFRQVIEHNPSSPLAKPSQLWLRLMENEEAAVLDAESNPSTDILGHFLRDWMERQLTARATPVEALRITEDAFKEQSQIVHGVLQGYDKQLRERDRQIADLRAQLEALRSIDQEHAAKQRKVKPPASLRMAERDFR